MAAFEGEDLDQADVVGTVAEVGLGGVPEPGAVEARARSSPVPGIPADPDAETPRGFTGHEHLDSVGLIHMNGRVYDPALGRFLSADPFVPNPTATQSFNRYSYVNNNPLSYADPSGFWGLGDVADAIGDAIGAIGDAIGDAIGAVGDAIGDAIGNALGALGGPFGIIGGFAMGMIGYGANQVALGFGNEQQTADTNFGDGYDGSGGSRADGIQVVSADRFSDAGFPHDGPGPNGELWDGRAAGRQGIGNSTGLTPASCDDCNDPGELQLAQSRPTLPYHSRGAQALWTRRGLADGTLKPRPNEPFELVPPSRVLRDMVKPTQRGSFRSRASENLRKLGLESVNLAGKSYNAGRKALENAGFVLQRVTQTGRKIFYNPNTRATVTYDSSKALGAGQNPHWTIQDKGGQFYGRSGRPVYGPSPPMGGRHIPGAR